MEDRKTRIAKLSERFKPHTGRPKLSPKERERRSYYLDTEIAERLDKDYKEFSHQLYPQTVSKSVFIETILEYGLDNLQTLREIIKEKSEVNTDNEQSSYSSHISYISYKYTCHTLITHRILRLTF